MGNLQNLRIKLCVTQHCIRDLEMCGGRLRESHQRWPGGRPGAGQSTQHLTSVLVVSVVQFGLVCSELQGFLQKPPGKILYRVSCHWSQNSNLFTTCRRPDRFRAIEWKGQLNCNKVTGRLTLVNFSHWPHNRFCCGWQGGRGKSSWVSTTAKQYLGGRRHYLG